MLLSLLVVKLQPFEIVITKLKILLKMCGARTVKPQAPVMKIQVKKVAGMLKTQAPEAVTGLGHN